MEKFAPPHPLARFNSDYATDEQGRIISLSVLGNFIANPIFEPGRAPERLDPRELSSFVDCENLWLEDLQLSPSPWQIISNFQRLLKLRMNRIKCSLNNFELLGKCTSLHRINFGMTKITDKELKTIGKLTNLTHLNLGPSRIQDLNELNHLRKLVEVDLGGIAISDKELRTWKKSDELERLFLEGTRVTDNGVAELARFPKLKLLTLQSAKVTTKVYEAISHLPLLETVYLAVDPGLDAIPHLRRLTKLKELYLGDYQTPEITERIQQELSINVY